MDVRDGFILGIYNYCDRWCETCAFTSRCRVFADRAEMDAAMDPYLKAVAEAPPLPEEEPPPPPRWMQEMIAEMNAAAREPLSPEEVRRLLPQVRPEHTPIERRARGYCLRTAEWLQAHGMDDVRDPADPRSVIGWFCTFLPPKIYRALSGLDDDWDDDDFPRDSDGSAKAALIGIERSHAAWLDLAERGLTTMTEATPFIAELIWLGEALERVFPKARAFVRPGFDEPEGVARLLADEQASG